MFYEAELRLLRDTFRKCRIQTCIADLSAPPDPRYVWGVQALLSGDLDAAALLRQLIPQVADATVYRLRDPLNCQYTYFRLPDISADSVFIIGPYLSEPPSEKQLMEWSEALGISPKQQIQLKNYYTTVPLLPESSHLFALLDSFYERLWGNGFSVEYLDQDALPPLPLLKEKSASAEEENTLWFMQNIEQRYQYENELIRAVSKGQLHKANLLLNGISTYIFEQRSADPVRNAKNYCIITNTLLRKAAEQGGVHPMYLDSTSSAFAIAIEQMASLDAFSEMMAEMFRAYCRLVRKYATKDYSPPVQQALICISGNLAGDLSLRSLSQTLNVSSSYLSTIFKKETGQTLTEYIARRRVELAKDLLRNTRLQIQTVAQHCGIMDVHYFSKVFKRITEQTPKEYRESLKK